MDNCLISVPYLLDTAKQDGGSCLGLCLEQRVLHLHKHKLEHKRNKIIVLVVLLLVLRAPSLPLCLCLCRSEIQALELSCVYGDSQVQEQNHAYKRPLAAQATHLYTYIIYSQPKEGEVIGPVSTPGSH